MTMTYPYPIHHGGMMRCCIETLLEARPPNPKKDDTVQCKYTDDPSHRWRFDGDGWHWDHE
jgi:hypothetical protein